SFFSVENHQELLHLTISFQFQIQPKAVLALHDPIKGEGGVTSVLGDRAFAFKRDRLEVIELHLPARGFDRRLRELDAFLLLISRTTHEAESQQDANDEQTAAKSAHLKPPRRA